MSSRRDGRLDRLPVPALGGEVRCETRACQTTAWNDSTSGVFSDGRWLDDDRDVGELRERASAEPTMPKIVAPTFAGQLDRVDEVE